MNDMQRVCCRCDSTIACDVGRCDGAGLIGVSHHTRKHTRMFACGRTHRDYHDYVAAAVAITAADDDDDDLLCGHVNEPQQSNT